MAGKNWVAKKTKVFIVTMKEFYRSIFFFFYWINTTITNFTRDTQTNYNLIKLLILCLDWKKWVRKYKKWKTVIGTGILIPAVHSHSYAQSFPVHIIDTNFSFAARFNFLNCHRK